MNALAVNELYRFFHMGDDETVALRGVSLEVFSGEMVAIVGPSAAENRHCLPALRVWTSRMADASKLRANA